MQTPRKLNPSLDHKQTKKLIFCPEYDTFLRHSKPALKQKIHQQLKEREVAIHAEGTQTIHELNISPLSNNNPPIPIYNISLLEHKHTINSYNKLIKEWQGPTYGARLITEHHEEHKQSHIKIIKVDFKAFMDRAINWIQQSSYKVLGRFFANHILSMKRHLKQHCSPHIIDYACFLFASRLLNAEINLHRAGLKPLIRCTTLRDSAEIQIAFGKLHPSLNLQQLKKSTKAKRKAIKKYTINAQSFAENVKRLCDNLLKKEQMRLHECDLKSVKMKQMPPNMDNFNCINTNSSVDMNDFEISNYGSVRGGSHIGASRKYRHNPSGMLYAGTNGIQSPQVIHNGLNTSACLPPATLLVSNNNQYTLGNVSNYNGMNGFPIGIEDICKLMNVDSNIRNSCSVCHQQTDSELCNRCQRVLNDINEMDFTVLMSLLFRSVHYARRIANWFCSRFN